MYLFLLFIIPWERVKIMHKFKNPINDTFLLNYKDGSYTS